LALWSEFAEQIKLDVFQAPSDKAEAEYVVHRIEQMVGGTSYFSLDSGRVGDSSAGARSFADFAVLFRLSSQAPILIEAFERSGIPYQVVGQAALASHRDIHDVLAVLWLRANPRARLHLAHVLAAGKAAWPAAAEEHLWALAKKAGFEWSAAFAQAAVDARFTQARRRRLADLTALWGELDQMPAGAPLTDAIRVVHGFVVSQAAAQPSPAQEERMARLMARAAPYGDRLQAFLEAMALQSEADVYDPRADRVALMTLHAAKGLEFPVVFLVGCEEGLLPYLPPGRDADVEEERRLFYVGMTRARQKLILTHAARRLLYGQRVEAPRSRFIADIEAALVEVQKRTLPVRRPGPEEQQLPLF
jgi:superfamily I DNA/RNA helicase